MADFIPYANLTEDQQRKFIDSESYVVRETSAKGGYGLDKLVDDEDYRVRAEVAKQGYGLDKLTIDTDETVRIEAYETLRRESITLEQWTLENPAKCALQFNKYGSHLPDGYGWHYIMNKNDMDVNAVVLESSGGMQLVEVNFKTQEYRNLVEGTDWQPVPNYTTLDQIPEFNQLAWDHKKALDLQIPMGELDEVEQLKNEIAALRAENISLEAIINDRNKEIDSLKERFNVNDRDELTPQQKPTERQKHRAPKVSKKSAKKTSIIQDAKEAKASSQAQSVKKSQMVKQSKGAR